MAAELGGAASYDVARDGSLLRVQRRKLISKQAKDIGQLEWRGTLAGRLGWRLPTHRQLTGAAGGNVSNGLRVAPR